MTAVVSIDARTGEVRARLCAETAPGELDEICARARTASDWLAQLDRGSRAKVLTAIADALEADRTEIVGVADAETALGAGRLNGELTRTCFQLRMFAEVLLEGSFLEATVDHRADTPMGPRPDIRRMLVPLGPVAVFGAGNFPLAFSVPGGDTASALAAGCAVVAKVHESHPQTSQLCAAVMEQAAVSMGAPGGAVGVVYGRDAGASLVQHQAITAVGFTGSMRGGRALIDLAAARPDPIPFYAELGSVNPLVVTEAAAASRGTEIGQGLAASFTLGSGQFCTKPGIAFVPVGPAGQTVVDAAAEEVSATESTVLLSAAITEAFTENLAGTISQPGVREVARGQLSSGSRGLAHLLEVDAAALTDSLVKECFGPVTVIVRYDGEQELLSSVRALPASLTAAVHAAPTGSDVGDALRRALEERSGRLVYNGFPTGVAVSWAQHHGGGWPASNSLHTSVGASAIRRFMRPFAWQDVPQALLPRELRDDSTDVPRRIDGALRLGP